MSKIKNSKENLQHTEEYKKRLMANKKEIIDYLQKKTGYLIRLRVEYDKNIGYRYSAQVSLDDFQTYAKWLLESTNKKNIKNELQTKILGIDWKTKKIGQSTKMSITKSLKSSAKNLECSICEEIKNVNCFHRNIHNPLFNKRGGYSFICHDCIIQEFLRIMQTGGSVEMGLTYICAIYNRVYCRELADKLQNEVSTPYDLIQKYFSYLNLTQYKGRSFADSDFFEEN